MCCFWGTFGLSGLSNVCPFKNDKVFFFYFKRVFVAYVVSLFSGVVNIWSH